MRMPAVLGRVTRVELCQCQDSLVLTVGPVSLRLDMLAAEDVAATLGHALSLLIPKGARAVERSRSPVAPFESAVRESDAVGAEASRPRDRRGDCDEWDVPTVPEPFGPESN
jgi:hypothetical protein